MTVPTSSRSGTLVRVALGLAAVGALFAAARTIDVRAAFAWIEAAGPAAPLAFVAIYVVACIVLLPGSILTLGAGAVFGLAKGVVVCSIGATLGATAAFLVGRHLLRERVAARIGDDPRLAAIDEAVATEGWKIVGLLRLSPVFPFNLLNYAFGLTRVCLRDYVLASWIGMIPGTITYVYLGSLAGDLANLGGERSRTSAEWALYGLGLLATLAATALVTKAARRSLDRRLAPGGAA